MAAYAALVSLVNDLDLIPIHPTHSFSFDHKQIAYLSQTVNSLIHFMDTYVPHGGSREAAQVLESRIASAAHAAHDVIESHVVDQIHAGTTLGRKPRSYFLLDLQKAIENMEFVERNAILFKERSGLKATWKHSAPASSEPQTSRKNAAMVGFDDVVVRLREKLTGEPCSRRIVPVVGMGGIGKTTLAKNVYENFSREHYFDVCRWATISHDYSVESILIELLTGERIFSTTSGGNVCELGEKLHKMLWKRRYLIVLDDMWSGEAWDEIQRFLPDNENRSCVIVTTRLSSLAAHLGSSPFKMALLDDDRSWKLFCASAFGEEDCPVELEELGKRIVKRCGGLPLSIVVTGGHLRRSSRAIGYWEMVANCVNPNSGLGEDDQCLKTISLSYEHLPACLKPCFLYLGIDASELIQFWVAEGFIKQSESLSLEEVAEDYLEDLIDRNFVFVGRRKWNEKVEYCRIHDIVRELCLKVGKQEKFLGVLDTTKAIGAGKERRVVVPRELSSLQRQAVGALQLPSLLRSLIGQGVWLLNELSVDLKLLRLVASVDLDIYMKKNGRYFPTPKFQLVNLRYLTFSVHPGALTSSIPSSISLFWNMQTLIIDNDELFKVLPYEIWEMTQLRHLEFTRRCLLPDPLPCVIGDRPNQQECIVLKNLHTLLGVESLRLTEEVCQRLPNIKKLYLSYGYLPDDCSYYCLHNLGRLNKLESLKCYFGDDSKWRGVGRSFILPSSLEELCLWRCHWEDLTKIIKSLPRLGSLELLYTRGPELDFAEEEFPRLKRLWIFGCDDLIYWNTHNSNFPVLENLYISRAPKLSEIPFDIGEIPTLQCISLDECTVSAAVSAMRIVKEQESLGNEDLLLQVNFMEMEQVERFQKTVQEECLTTNSLHLLYCYKTIGMMSFSFMHLY